MKRLNILTLIFLVFTITSFTSMVFAQAVPPDLVNYQGILRDSSDSPLTGDYDMKFQFFNVATGGSAILIDDHLAAGTGAVTVTDGLFNAHLGGGAVSDGPAGGTYDELYKVFRDYGTVYLEVQVYNSDTPAWETLNPRIQIVSAAYALNTDHLDGTNSDQFLRSDTGDNFTSGTLTIDSGTTLDVDGTLQMDGSVTKATTDLVTNFNADLLDGLHSSSFSLTGHTHPGSDITSPVPSASDADTLDGFDSTYFLNTSSTAQTKSGPLTLNASGAVAYGIDAEGQTGGGYFHDSDSTGYSYVGYGNSGISAYGTAYGGYFVDPDSSGRAYTAIGDTGIEARGNNEGGYFIDSDDTGYAYVGDGNYGIRAFGSSTGGYFKDSDSSGQAYVGNGDNGIIAEGNNVGGSFSDLDQSGSAYVGYGDTGVEARGSIRGGYFYDSDSSGSAYVGYGDTGIEAGGSSRGAYFYDSDNSGYAYIGYGDRGIEAYGNTVGGVFYDALDSGYAWVGTGNNGIMAYGSNYGGYFKDTDNTSYAQIADGDYGIKAYGNNTAGWFQNLLNSGEAWVARGETGIDARGNTRGGYFADKDDTAYANVADGNGGIEAYGSDYGGSFSDTDHSGAAHVGIGDYGIKAYGSAAGGYFADSTTTPSGYAYAGEMDYGIEAYGNTAGGFFQDLTASGYAYVGYGERGIEAYGNIAGGYFEDLDASGLASVGVGNRGIWGRGTFAGATFSHPDGTTYWADVSNSTRKIVGSGTVSFVQNHPYDKSKVITYAAPEGDEVAVYTRGTARLIDGQAIVKLGESFSWVANPDIGLTAHITPRGEQVVLSVDSLTTTEMTVRGPAGSNAVFDYIVYGLRIGFEELAVVQEKDREAFLPASEDVQEPYSVNPELRGFNAFERFKKMRKAIGETGEIDLTRSWALVNAIEENKQEILKQARERMEMERKRRGLQPEENQGLMPETLEGRPHPPSDPPELIDQQEKTISTTMPVDEEGNIHAKSFRSVSPDLTGNVSVSEQVEVGDVLVMDSMNPGMMRLSEMSADPAVIGIVAGEPGVVLGGGMIDIAKSESENDQQMEETPVDIAEESQADSLGEDESPVPGQLEAGLYQAQAPVALSGIVLCKVDAGYGSIQMGDLLTTSPTKGHAMRSVDYAPGTIIGKALEPLDAGTGLIKVLVFTR